VLVTGVDRAVGAAVAHEFHARGFDVHGTHQNPGTAEEVPGMRWHLVPRSEDPAYLPTVHRLVQRHGVSIVIPTLDEELPVMAGVRRWPDPGVLVVVSGPGPVNLAQDKLLACWQLAGHAVATPPCASPSDFRDTKEALDAMGGAAVVRARRAGRTGIGARVVLDAGELDWERLDDDFIVQQFAPGREYLCVLYRPDGPARRGTVVLEALSPGPRHEQVRALPPGEAEDVERTAWAAVRALGILGPAEVVVRRAADDTPTVLSVHPRFSRHCSELLDQLSTPEPLPRPRSAPEQGRGRARRNGHHEAPSSGRGPETLS
jgi:carbamoyl-phosphate synthase large subunit